MIKIAPSILSADFGNMQQAIEMLNEAGADYVHCDVMDGMFVPNITFGFQMISAVKKVAKMPLDVHLMIVEPERYIERFAQAGADLISIHAEATNHLQRALVQIKEAGAKPAVVLNPATPTDVLKYVMNDVDLILLMSVNPGYGGQSFIPAVLDKVKEVRSMIEASGRKIELEIDGGVSLKNNRTLIEAGADVLVAGSAVFGAEDPKTMIKALRG
ncbi:MAG: ribulose-phosphate 3-epimerase [Christensenella sp.]|nr:ribulose-phosphate 3-epimerase [Christensenella sp.]